MSSVLWLLPVIAAYLLLRPFEVHVRAELVGGTLRGRLSVSAGARRWSLTSFQMRPRCPDAAHPAAVLDFLPVLRRLKWVDRLDVSIRVRAAAGGPARTAISAGATWAAIGSLICAGRAAGIPLREVRAQVTPDFDGDQSYLAAHCIGRFRAGKLILSLMTG